MAVITQALATYLANIAQTHSVPRLVIYILLLVLTLDYVVTTLKQYYRLRHIPGPKFAAFSSLWIALGETGGRMYKDLYEVTEKYGPIARIGPNEIVTSDPAFIKHTTNVRTNYQRSEWYYGMRFDPTKDNVLSTRDDAGHTKLRAKMVAGYSGKDLANLESTIDAQILTFLALLKSYITASQPFDFAPKAQYFTLDTISSLSYSTPFGFLAADSDLYSYLSTTARQLPVIMLTTVYPLLVTLLSSPLLKPLLPSDKDLLGFGRIQSIVKSHVSERFSGTRVADGKGPDMLDSFITHGLTQDEAESEVIMQFVAGSDTTATAIRATLLYIITNPRIVDRIHEELFTAGYTTTNPPEDKVISSHESVTLLPYMQATIKEGLRMYPPVPSLLSKEVPPEGDTWKGVYLPPGTKVGVCMLGAMRDKDIWGLDADEFNPGRWVDVEEERLKEMDSTLSLVFSNGRWQCLGREIAMMELNKIFVELLRRFDLVVVDPTKPWNSIHAGIFVQSEFWLRGYLRE